MVDWGSNDPMSSAGVCIPAVQSGNCLLGELYRVLPTLRTEYIFITFYGQKLEWVRKAYKCSREGGGMVQPLFVGGIPGGPELLIILGIAVLLFGANKLPDLARSMGSATGEFKKGRKEVEQELEAATAGESAQVDAQGESDVERSNA